MIKEYLKVINTNINKLKLKHGVRPGTRILVALSGGMDSVALLLALVKLRDIHRFEIYVCHVNHCVRGIDSDLDAQFCENLAQTLNVKIKVYNLGFDNNTDLTYSEDYLRQCRYKKLIECAKSERINFIFTAHTLDDQVETILFRFFRGTKINGFQGIKAYYKLDSKIYLCRIMLDIPKLNNKLFLESLKQPWKEDASNLNLDYTRNFIRQSLIPLISSRFKNFKENLLNFKNYLSRRESFINKHLKKYWKLCKIGKSNLHLYLNNLGYFKKMDKFTQSQILVRCLQSLNIEVSDFKVKQILNLVRRYEVNNKRLKLNLNNDYSLLIVHNKLIFLYVHDLANTSLFNNYQAVLVNKNGNTIIPWLNKTLTITKFDSHDNILKDPNSFAIDVNLDQIEPLYIRIRRPGDIIQPFGSLNNVKLKKYIHTHKSHLSNTKPFNQRPINPINWREVQLTGVNAAWFVLANDSEVLWVPGLGISEKLRYKLVPSHRLTIKRINDDIHIT